MQQKAPDYEQQLAWIIARVNRRLEEELAEHLRPTGLPIEQFRVLEAIGQRGPMTMGELAAAALVERPTLTKIVDRMVSAGLVFREPDERDRRRVNIVLAPEGAAMRRRLEGVSLRIERRLSALLEGPGERSLPEMLRALS